MHPPDTGISLVQVFADSDYALGDCIFPSFDKWKHNPVEWFVAIHPRQNDTEVATSTV